MTKLHCPCACTTKFKVGVAWLHIRESLAILQVLTGTFLFLFMFHMLLRISSMYEHLNVSLLVRFHTICFVITFLNMELALRTQVL